MLSNYRFTETSQPIDREQWGRMAAPCFYSSSDWQHYQSLEASVQATFVRATTDNAAGVCSLFRTEHEASSSYRIETFIPSFRGSMPVLMGNRRGYRNRLLHEGLSSEAALESQFALLSQLFSEAPAKESFFLPYLPTSDAAWLEASFGCQPFLMTLDSDIALPGRSFDDYLSGLSVNGRRSVRSDRHHLASSITWCGSISLLDNIERIAQLIANLERKYGNELDVQLMVKILERQHLVFGDALVVYGCMLNNILTACCVTFETQDAVVMRAVGLDYDRIGGGEYFEVAYYQPITRAYEIGVSTVHLGTKSYDVKVRRGASVHPLWGIVLENGRSPISPEDAAKTTSKIAATIESELPTRSQGWSKQCPTHWFAHPGN
jgi:uncharacterized protein